MAEKFDYNKVQSTIEDLEVLFDTFADKLRIANDAVTEYVNNGPTIYGDYGKALLNLWDENSSTFGDFKANFDDWVKMVTIVGINNQNFENNITKATDQMTREEFANSNYGKFISNSNYGSKVTDSNYSKLMGFDEEYGDVYDANYDGEIQVRGNEKWYIKDGFVEAKVFYNSDGTIREIQDIEKTQCGTNGNGEPVYKLTYHVTDGDGNIVTSKDGYVEYITEGQTFDNLDKAQNYGVIDYKYFQPKEGTVEVRETVIVSTGDTREWYTFTNSAGAEIERVTNGRTSLYRDITNGKYYNGQFVEIDWETYSTASDALK